MEDADDSGNVIEGTPVYAASAAPSPTKERSNTSRSRRDRPRRSGSTSPTVNDPDVASYPVSRRDSKMKPKEKEKLSSSSSNRKTVVTRPGPTDRSSRTIPALPTSLHDRRAHEEAQYYGVSPDSITSAASSRPRSHAQQRPASYYSQQPIHSRPPLSNPRYYPHPHHGAVPGSYPGPQWGPPASYAMPPSPVVRQPPPPPGPDYFSGPRPLGDRFNRPQSAIGHRPHPAPLGYGDDYEEEPRKAIRRISLTKKAREDEDRKRMPPPPQPQRTMSARPLSSRSGPFAPPSAPYPRYGGGFDDEVFESDDNSLYQDVQPVVPFEYGSSPLSVSRPRRPSVGASTLVYDLGSYRTEVASSRNNRRNSYYGGQTSVSSGSPYEDKLREAFAYQEDVSGAPMPLTAETLRKATKHGGPSSRSTRSSGSQDESDYRQSATTRTTRSSNNDEEVTIRVKGGGAVLTAGNAQMHCDDGAEITITSRPSGGALRGSSDQASTIYTEDRRSRMERLPFRPRSSSQAYISRSAVPQYSHGWNNQGPFRPPPPQLPGPEWHVPR